MHEIGLGVTTKDGELVEALSAVFEKVEIDLLRRYSNFVDRVRETTLLRRGMPSISNMKWTPDEGMKWTCEPYENSELHELLHVLRPLLLSQEATSFERVTGLLGRKFQGEKFRGHLKLQRSVFEDGELKLYMKISINDQPLLDESLIKLWLNGEQYHTDEEKAIAWRKVKEALRKVCTTQAPACRCAEPTGM